jgi:hypothetical protein
MHNALVREFPPDDWGLEEEEGVKQVGMREGCYTRIAARRGCGQAYNAMAEKGRRGKR